jgi:DNA invertase Pin-like site-specific DNA recombinase
MRAAIYARVSTADQEPENQLAELRRYVGARRWTAIEYVDRGVREPKIDGLRSMTSPRPPAGADSTCWCVAP